MNHNGSFITGHTRTKKRTDKRKHLKQVCRIFQGSLVHLVMHLLLTKGFSPASCNLATFTNIYFLFKRNAELGALTAPVILVEGGAPAGWGAISILLKVLFEKGKMAARREFNRKMFLRICEFFKLIRAQLVTILYIFLQL